MTDPSWLNDLTLRKAYDADGALLPARAGFQGTDGIALVDSGTRTKITLALDTVGSHKPVRAVATANIANLAIISVNTFWDELTLEEVDRVLLPVQTNAYENGIYVVGEVTGGAAALTRATDFATAGQMVAGTLFTVQEGSGFAGEVFRFETTGAIVVETTTLVFRTLSGLRFVGTATLSSGGGPADIYSHTVLDEYMTTFETLVVAQDVGGDTCHAQAVAAVEMTGAVITIKREQPLEPNYLDDAAWTTPDYVISGGDIEIRMTPDAANDLTYKVWVKVWERPL